MTSFRASKRVFRCDLRIGIRHGEDDGILRHRLHHLLREDPLDGDARKDIRPAYGISKRPRIGVDREELLVRVHPFLPPLVDDAFRVHQDEIFALDAELHVELCAGNPGGAGAAEDNLHVPDLLSDDLQRVHQARPGDDGRPVLIVVEHRDLHRLLQLFLDVETLRRFDVLEVDAAERRLQRPDDPDDLFGVVGIQFDIKDIDVGESLEENAFSFHHRLPGEGSDVAEAQHRRTVADDGDQVPLGGILVSITRVRVNLATWLRHPGGVGHREVTLGCARFGRNDFDLSAPSLAVIIKSVLLANEGHGWPPCGEFRPPEECGTRMRTEAFKRRATGKSTGISSSGATDAGFDTGVRPASTMRHILPRNENWARPSFLKSRMLAYRTVFGYYHILCSHTGIA